MSQKKGGLGSSLTSAFRRLRGLPIVDKEAIDAFLKDIEKALISADVKVDLVRFWIKELRERAISDKIPPAVSRKDYIIKLVYDELIQLLGQKNFPLVPDVDKVNVYMFIGIQGSGKTSSLSKLAYYWKKRGLNPAVIAADTFRPGAYQQLHQLLVPKGIPVIGEDKPKDDAPKLVKKALEQLKKEGKYNVIFIDTSGRHKEEKGLLKEMGSIAKKAKPDEIILVIDGTIGQMAYVQAETFNSTVDAGSIIITKMDGSAKGGGALSAVAATNSKIRFITTGEAIEEIEAFSPNRFVSQLLGMGDIQGILERIQTAGLMEDQEDLMKAFKKGKVSLELYKMQIEKMSGSSMTKLLGMIPGFSMSQLPTGAEAQSKDMMKKNLSILNSLTQQELKDHTLINRSRKERIAKGSGTTLVDINNMLQQFKQFGTMMKKMKTQRRKGIPGMKGGFGM